MALRRGGRVLGGALSWEKPAHLAPFDAESPFAGLAIPDDVTVTRQVLAEPSLEEGLRVQAVYDAVRTAELERRWVAPAPVA